MQRDKLIMFSFFPYEIVEIEQCVAMDRRLLDLIDILENLSVSASQPGVVGVIHYKLSHHAADCYLTAPKILELLLYNLHHSKTKNLSINYLILLFQNDEDDFNYEFGSRRGSTRSR